MLIIPYDTTLTGPQVLVYTIQYCSIFTQVWVHQHLALNYYYYTVEAHKHLPVKAAQESLLTYLGFDGVVVAVGVELSVSIVGCYFQPIHLISYCFDYYSTVGNIPPIIWSVGSCVKQHPLRTDLPCAQKSNEFVVREVITHPARPTYTQESLPWTSCVRWLLSNNKILTPHTYPMTGM